MWPDVPPPLVVNPVPVNDSEPDESERDFPEVFVAMFCDAPAGGEPDRVRAVCEFV